MTISEEQLEAAVEAYRATMNAAYDRDFPNGELASGFHGGPDHKAALRAALLSVEQGRGWRPIVSSPTPGAQVMGLTSISPSEQNDVTAARVMDKAIEAAAQALAAAEYPQSSWDGDLGDADREAYREDAEAALQAAAPILKAEHDRELFLAVLESTRQRADADLSHAFFDVMRARNNGLGCREEAANELG